MWSLHFRRVMIGLAALFLAGIGRPSEPPPEPRPPEPDDAILSDDRGEALFRAHCADCHSGAIAPSAAELGRHDAATFDRMVRDHPEVFAFEGLTAQDLIDIHAWLQTQAAPE